MITSPWLQQPIRWHVLHSGLRCVVVWLLCAMQMQYLWLLYLISLVEMVLWGVALTKENMIQNKTFFIIIFEFSYNDFLYKLCHVSTHEVINCSFAVSSALVTCVWQHPQAILYIFISISIFYFWSWLFGTQLNCSLWLFLCYGHVQMPKSVRDEKHSVRIRNKIIHH